MGNEGDVDAAGFVTAFADECNQDIAKHMLFTRMHRRSLNFVIILNLADRKFGTVNYKLEAVSNCWICEGWSEAEFKFKPPV